METVKFGPHLLLDMRVGLSDELLNDREWWSNFLSELVAKAGMTVINGPVVEYTGCTNERWSPATVTGLSGYVVLAESHASFHTFVEHKYVFLDIFSCKNFETVDLIDWVTERLKVTDMDEVLEERGKNFPRL